MIETKTNSAPGSTVTKESPPENGKKEADTPKQGKITKSHLEKYMHLYLSAGAIVIAFACGLYFMKKGGDSEGTDFMKNELNIRKI